MPENAFKPDVAFRLLLAVPAVIMLARYAVSGGGLGLVLQASGEWAARLLILTLAVTPLRLLLRRWPAAQPFSMWLFKCRRSLGLAAFLYAVLHVVAYLLRRSDVAAILSDLPYKEYAAGWIALITMAVLSFTSSDAVVHGLGLWWKRLQRLAYVSAAAAFLHWFWIRHDSTAVFIHFIPLAALEAYRLWSRFARPAGSRH